MHGIAMRAMRLTIRDTWQLDICNISFTFLYCNQLLALRLACS